MGRLTHLLHRPLSELLRLGLITALVLPALLGALHRPPAMQANANGEAALLWSDLASLCTPLGPQRDQDKRVPMGPMASCPLCVLLHGAGWAMPETPPALPAPGRAMALAASPEPALVLAQHRPLRPPGRGPPALLPIQRL